VVGIDTRGRHGGVVSEIDSERVRFEALSYCLRLLDDGSENLEMHKEVESVRHPLEMAEGTWCTEYRHLRGREVVSKWSSGWLIRGNWWIHSVGYFRMELVKKVARNGHGSSKAGLDVSGH
jgi:hypothetical protein